MTEQKSSPLSTSSRPRSQPSNPDDPLKFRHGERLLAEISVAQTTASATKNDTEAILELLNPPPDEESPILTILLQIVAAQGAHTEQLDRIENRLFDMDRRLGQLAQRFK